MQGVHTQYRCYNTDMLQLAPNVGLKFNILHMITFTTLAIPHARCTWIYKRIAWLLYVILNDNTIQLRINFFRELSNYNEVYISYVQLPTWNESNQEMSMRQSSLWKLNYKCIFYNNSKFFIEIIKNFNALGSKLGQTQSGLA